MYHVFHGLPKKKDLNKKRVTAPILKPTYDQKPETFLAFCNATQNVQFDNQTLLVKID